MVAEKYRALVEAADFHKPMFAGVRVEPFELVVLTAQTHCRVHILFLSLAPSIQHQPVEGWHCSWPGPKED